MLEVTRDSRLQDPHAKRCRRSYPCSALGHRRCEQPLPLATDSALAPAVTIPDRNASPSRRCEPLRRIPKSSSDRPLVSDPPDAPAPPAATSSWESSSSRPPTP